jgi:hypothetical protein
MPTKDVYVTLDQADANDIAQLGKPGSSFRVQLIEWERSNSLRAGSRLPVHKRVMSPIVAASEECFVYALATKSPALKRSARILRPARGKHAIDTSGEAVVGHESLWNSAAPDRGSIVAIVPVDKFDRSVLRYGLRFYTLDIRGASNTPAAIRYCQAAAKLGKLGFCFDFHSARNVQVYGPPEVLQDLYASFPKSKRGVRGFLRGRTK